MTPGQRWLAAGAPWREGMRLTAGLRAYRVVDVYPDYGGSVVWVVREESHVVEEVPADGEPDLTDDATRGAALGWLREAWGSPHLTTEYVGGYWTVYDYDTERSWGDHCATEADALAAAAEALAGREP